MILKGPKVNKVDWKTGIVYQSTHMASDMDLHGQPSFQSDQKLKNNTKVEK